MEISARTKIALLVASALVLVGCGSKPPGPIVTPYSPITKDKSNWVEVDPDIGRIYGDPPVTGRLPVGMSWSPDGKTLAYLKARNTPEGKTMGLWILEMTGMRLRPLVADADVMVEDFAWIDEGRLLLTMGGDLYLSGMTGDPVRLTETEAAEEYAVPSAAGDRVAFLREGSLYVMDLKTRQERPVVESEDPKKTFGTVTWVYGEEFGTERGFQWAPKGDSLWFFAVDETPVKGRVVVRSPDGSTSTQSYPRAGEPNPIVKVGVADVSKEKPEISWMETGAQTDVYLPQVTWFPGGDELAVVRLDRLQTTMSLVGCDSKKGTCREILEERDPRWVNLLGEPAFSNDGKRFYWLSERDGFAHIYSIMRDGVVEKQLTEGDWVVSSIDSVDEKGGQLFFTGSPESPVLQGIYRVPLSGGDVERVSPEGGVHRAVFSDDSKRYVDVHSSLDLCPQADLYNAEGEHLAPVGQTDRGVYKNDLIANDLYPIETKDGLVLWAQMTRPRALQPGKKYPVVVYVYGGPGAQVVRDHFRTSFQAWRNLMAKRGILVFSLDGRGSAGRGKEFENHIHRNLGEVELEDQLTGVKYLKTLPYVDEQRLAVFGWSYGGTMTLRALLFGEGVFKAGVAVAPVTDWREYDTAYTERYMQRPEDNEAGYEKTDLVKKAEQLEAPLLLVHGLADDNVHPANSMRFVDALIAAGKNFEWFVYPGKKHGIRGAEARTHLFTRITRFFEEHL